MATGKLAISMRNTSGRRKAIRLRNEGFVPGILYGNNKETKPIKINKRELQKYFSRYGHSGTVNIDIDGKITPVIIKEVQRDIISDEFLHVDFQQLSENEKIKIHVPLIITGKERVEDSSTILEQQTSEVEVQCLPRYIPQSIIADVSSLELGKHLTIGDLPIVSDENLEVLNELNQVVASLTAAAKEETDEETAVPIYASDKSILDE